MKRRIKRLHILLILLLVAVCAIPFRTMLRMSAVGVVQMIKGKHSVADRVDQYGEAVHGRLSPFFHQAEVAYPPAKVTLVGLKAERTVQVWVSGQNGEWKHLRDYPILGMSGTLGPKLKEGDMQVPEGLYQVESLNPNSLFHLALRVNYPSPEDRRRAAAEGRAQLGSDIMIHGKECSVGCLAMGDEAAEDLFVLAAESGIENVSIILSPVDFRVRELPNNTPPPPAWAGQLYDSIRSELGKMGRQGREPSPNAVESNTLPSNLHIPVESLAPPGWRISGIDKGAKPYGWDQTPGKVSGIGITLAGPAIVRGAKREPTKECITLYVMPQDFSPVELPPPGPPEDSSVFMGSTKHGKKLYAKAWSEIQTWPDWKADIQKRCEVDLVR